MADRITIARPEEGQYLYDVQEKVFPDHKANPGDRGVLSGADEITGWTQCTSSGQAGGNPNYANIWYAYAPAGTTAWSSNLHENDAVCTLAQDPNQPALWLMDNTDYFYNIPCANMTTTSVTGG